MTVQLPLDEVIITAKQKLSGVSACLNDSSAFRDAVLEFDKWLSEHKEIILASNTRQPNERQEIEQLIHQLSRLELQARYNITLVENMHTYIHEQLECISTPHPLQNQTG